MNGANANWSRPVACGAGAYLAHARERHNHCYILLEGVLIREKLLDNERRQIVGLHVPGDVCGLSALSDGRADHDIVALSPASYVAVPRDWLSSCAQESADLLKAVWREMSREAAISAAWTVNIGQRSAYQRLAHFMCEVDARMRAAGHDTGAAFEWPGTQGDIGAATGLSLVHVNKTLRRLEAESLVSCGRPVKFKDVAKLGTIAGFDPGYLALDRESLGDMLLSHVDDISAARSEETVGPLEESSAGLAMARLRMAG